MKVTLLGTGTPWVDLNRQGPAVLIQSGDDTILIDAGRGAVYQAQKVNVSADKINPVFITHHHFDHFGDLFDVILSSWTAGRTTPLKIFGPSGTSDIVSALVEGVYGKDIHFRVDECAATGNTHLDGSNIAKLETHEVKEPGLIYETKQLQVKAEFVKHYYDSEPPRFDWKCLGYRVTSQNKSVVVSGDTVSCEGLDRLAKGADLLIQCCISANADNQHEQGKHLTSYVLPASTEVGEIASRANVTKLVLTHIAAYASLDKMVTDVRKAYTGELIIGEDLLEIEV
jgi:ribonuclease BN (tRNA processing enzyme)